MRARSSPRNAAAPAPSAIRWSKAQVSVMVGRATTFGLAAAGEPGVAKALTILGSEISRTLALVGCRNLAELSRDLIQM